MMKHFNKIILSLLTALLFLSCSRVQKTEAEKEREAWIAGFTDSISSYQKRSAEIDYSLSNINGNISSIINDFEMVRNPREVSGYYILKGWNSMLPFTNTGIYARINEHEKLELIATLGGATFNQISVGGIYSEKVPHDQAFNFRHERFNTVYFSGEKSDSVAWYIAMNETKPVNLNYLEGKIVKKYALSEKEKNMIALTYRLYSQQKEAHKLQKEQWICSKKIETFRRLMDMENMLPENIEKQ